MEIISPENTKQVIKKEGRAFLFFIFVPLTGGMGFYRFFGLFLIVLLPEYMFCMMATHISGSTDTLLLKAGVFEQNQQFDSALIVYKQIENEQEERNLALIKLKLANTYRELKKYDSAKLQLNAYELLKAKGLNQPLWEAEYFFVLGKMKVDVGDFSNAIPIFDTALRQLDGIDSPNKELLSRIYNYLGIANHFLGNFDKALFSYRQAARFHDKQTGYGMDLADILQNMAIIYSVQGRFDSASYLIQESKQIRELHIDADDEQMASFYVNYGRFLLMLGKQSESLELYQKAEVLFRKKVSSNEEYLGPVLINIGNAFQLRGDYEKAAAYYQNAIHVLNRVFEKGHPYLVSVENNLAFVHNQLGQYEASLVLSKKNELFNSQVISKIRLYRNMAKSFQGLENHEEAQLYFQKAIELALESLGPNHYEYGATVIDLGDYLFQFGKVKEALNEYKLALGVYEKVFDSNDTEIAILKRKTSTCYLQLQQFKMAEQYFSETEQLLNAASSALDDHRKMLLTDLYFDQGKLYSVWYDSVPDIALLQQSFKSFQKGMAMMDDFSQAISDESRMTLGENLRAGLNAAIDVAYKLFKQTKNKSFAEAAFEIAGKGKSVVLLSSVKKNQALISAGIPEEFIELESKIKQDIMSLSKLTSEERQRTISNELKIAFFEEQRLDLIQKYDSLLHQLELQYPDYYTLRYDLTVVSVKHVQEKLKADEMLIEYMLSPNDCYVIAISKDQLMFERQLQSDSITKAVIELRQQSVLNFTAHGREEFDRFLNLSTKLYGWLLQPLTDMMADKRLIIVPDAVLGYLPFELLVNPSNLPADHNDVRFYQDLPYLFYNHPISYAFSSTLKFASTSRKAHPSAGLWAYVPDYTSGVVSEVDSLASMRMQALPYAREEAESILKVWKNGKLMLSSDASKSNFLAFAPQAHILHLAMHAIIDDDNPLYSRLVFQQDSINPNSFELNTYELYSLRLNASLAVLSACNTGSGILRYGEGVISLTRGFIYAGVPSIVMSSWEVNDKAGAVLMEYFYQYLHDGYPKDVALQKARIEYLKNVNLLKGHPFFWGAYMLIGDNQPIENIHNQRFLFYFAIPILLLGLLIFWKMRKKQ